MEGVPEGGQKGHQVRAGIGSGQPDVQGPVRVYRRGVRRADHPVRENFFRWYPEIRLFRRAGRVVQGAAREGRDRAVRRGVLQGCGEGPVGGEGDGVRQPA